MTDSKPFKWTLVLENSGSTARDHLANERTFLAWLRTSLTLVTVGVAITQFSQHIQPSQSDSNYHIEEALTKVTGGKVVGVIYAIVGLIFGIFGIIRYFIIQNNLVYKRFQASRFLVTVGFTMVVGLALAMVLSFWL